MTDIPIPENYGSLEELCNWLRIHLPHEFDVDGGPRWKVIAGGAFHIEFARSHDATYFNLKWKH